ncbi:3-hydroxyacyl-CoA dehydrogenase NAD-binding domain-containing protein [Bermanella sp. R86510]|uniref:3-hydroxyacyl-CoA dehydrogenase NAD-binding domain-containing protein n=1 Tax=unclassified Bermanella TaxID=2627862 RepID=UPI0037C6B975
MTDAIHYEKDSDNIVTLTMDMPGQSANTMNADFRESILAIADRLENEKDSISGVIYASAKDTFFAGGDLKELIAVTKDDAEDFFNMVEQIKAPLRKIETLGVPVVAAINGAALGGGFEICLASHHRIALNNPKLKVGLPEVTLGLLPGGGGVARMVRLLGLEAAFPFLMEGKQVNPEKALKAGLIHDIADNSEDLMAKAKAWVKANPKSTQPWDVKGYKLPGGAPSHPAVAQKLAIVPSVLRQKTKGCYPAPEKILAAAVEGAQVTFDEACTIESRYFTELTTSQIAKNMIGTFWFQLNEIKAGGSRPNGIDKQVTKKLGILGAGMMGAGIAYSTAMSGIDVVLKDVSMEAAEKGKAYSDGLLKKRISRKQMSEEKAKTVLDRILPTDKAEDLEGCDLIIEAVFENRELKAKVTQEAEAFLDKDGVFASNTSTLPITGLATASKDESKFIGLHFFSPVDKMPLVEIIMGEKTNDETLAKAFDYVLQINKTPIVVNDSRGFFTSRTFGTFVNEGIRMLAEGVEPQFIESAALQAGMPVGPLAVQDEVSLTLSRKVTRQTREDLQAEGSDLEVSPAEALIDSMIDDFKREGKAAGAGFYDYPAKGKKQLWPGLREHFVKADASVDFEEAKERLLFIQAIETLRCYEEKVLTSVRDANIGSIFGIGFAPWTGGAIQYVNQYGVRNFYQRAKDLTDKYGERFNPPKILAEHAEKDILFK